MAVLQKINKTVIRLYDARAKGRSGLGGGGGGYTFLFEG